MVATMIGAMLLDCMLMLSFATTHVTHRDWVCVVVIACVAIFRLSCFDVVDGCVVLMWPENMYVVVVLW